MRHFLFEITSGDYEGEEIIVGADTLAEARQIGKEEIGSVHFLCELSEEEAEASGLDEY